MHFLLTFPELEDLRAKKLDVILSECSAKLIFITKSLGIPLFLVGSVSCDFFIHLPHHVFDFTPSIDETITSVKQAVIYEELKQILVLYHQQHCECKTTFSILILLLCGQSLLLKAGSDWLWARKIWWRHELLDCAPETRPHSSVLHLNNFAMFKTTPRNVWIDPSLTAGTMFSLANLNGTSFFPIDMSKNSTPEELQESIVAKKTAISQIAEDTPQPDNTVLISLLDSEHPQKLETFLLAVGWIYILTKRDMRLGSLSILGGTGLMDGC